MAWGSPCRGPRLGGARGGRIVVIVLDSADLDSAAAAIVGSVGTPPALVSRGSLGGRWWVPEGPGGSWGGLGASQGAP